MPTLYRSYRQAPPYYTTLAMRTNGDPLKFVSTVRDEIANVDPNLPMYNIKSMDKVITEAIVGIAYVAVMMTVLGVIALRPGVGRNLWRNVVLGERADARDWHPHVARRADEGYSRRWCCTAECE